MSHVPSTRELDRVPTCPAAAIKDLRARPDAAVDQPPGDHGAFLANGSIDEEVERPGVLCVERATHDLVHRNVVFVGLTSQMSRALLRQDYTGVWRVGAICMLAGR